MSQLHVPKNKRPSNISLFLLIFSLFTMMVISSQNESTVRWLNDEPDELARTFSAIDSFCFCFDNKNSILLWSESENGQSKIKGRFNEKEIGTDISTELGEKGSRILDLTILAHGNGRYWIAFASNKDENTGTRWFQIKVAEIVISDSSTLKLNWKKQMPPPDPSFSGKDRNIGDNTEPSLWYDKENDELFVFWIHYHSNSSPKCEALGNCLSYDNEIRDYGWLNYSKRVGGENGSIFWSDSHLFSKPMVFYQYKDSLGNYYYYIMYIEDIEKYNSAIKIQELIKNPLDEGSSLNDESTLINQESKKELEVFFSDKKIHQCCIIQENDYEFNDTPGKTFFTICCLYHSKGSYKVGLGGFTIDKANKGKIDVIDFDVEEEISNKYICPGPDSNILLEKQSRKGYSLFWLESRKIENTNEDIFRILRLSFDYDFDRDQIYNLEEADNGTNPTVPDHISFKDKMLRIFSVETWYGIEVAVAILLIYLVFYINRFSAKITMILVCLVALFTVIFPSLVENKLKIMDGILLLALFIGILNIFYADYRERLKQDKSS